MKILDRYILSSYLKTFISVFVILMLIFVLQAIWLYIKELAGKDLDVSTVLKFLFYITPTLIPLILPLTILLASIMVFGNFAENYEFAAMKSTGISLQRAMAGLSIFIVLLAITTFFFTNNVIPRAEFESYNLRKNIAKVKPQQFIAKGQFNQLGDNFNIKVEDKYGPEGRLLKKVVIHKGQTRIPGNHTVIIAKTGKLASAEDSEVLKLILFDGYYYDDTPPKKVQERKKNPHVKSTFKEYTINLDLSKLNTVDLEDKSFDSKYTMLSISELDTTTDSLITERHRSYEQFGETLYNRSNIATLNLTVNAKKDSIFKGNILDLFETKRQVQLLDYAINASSSTNQIIVAKQNNIKGETIWLNKHIMAMHEKFALSIACIILFFVGAPLGALIRKGGLGLPMVIAIVLFLSYHFIGIFAKNSAKDGSFNPALATWFSTLIMLPLSIYLTTRATADRGLFEFDHITIPVKNWYHSRFGNKKLIIKEDDDDTIVTGTLKVPSKTRTIIANKEYQSLFKTAIITFVFGLICFVLYFVFANNKLPQFATILMQLSGVLVVVSLFYFIKSKRIENKELIIEDSANTTSLASASEGKIKTKPTNKAQNSLFKTAVITFVFAFICFILYFVFTNNKRPQFASVVMQLSGILALVSLFYFIKSKRQS
ncbi:LptF/LptG family permease [Lacinutrix sp. Hel_I_90]|uniref:LptF/LptG family permease n=1 Tax=Lacinutrix sp. Hel_I_90 TaxID=1249999 RepID=UPI0009E4845E|nr:LptF/LptG family permease [Lacinutrix sp. Hel_I_90]